MIFSKRSFLAYCSAFACSFSLYAAEASKVSTTKTSSQNTFFQGAYSTVEMGVTQKSELDDKTGKGKDFERTTSGTYVVGSTFFDKKLDLSATLGTELAEGSTVLKDAGTKFAAAYTVYKNDYYNVSTTAKVGLPASGETRTSTSLGGSHELSYKFETGAGELSTTLGHTLSVGFGDEPSLAKLSQNGKDVKKEALSEDQIKELDLVTKDKDDFVYAKQQAPGVSQTVSLGVSWKPSYVKGLSLSASTAFSQTKSPAVELSEDKKSLDHKTREYMNWPLYNDKNSFENTLSAKYEFNKETQWVSLSFGFSDANDQNERSYNFAGSVGMKLL